MASSAPTQRIRLLDSLRGVAALIVVLHHACTLFPRCLALLAEHSLALTQLVRGVARFNTEAVLLFFVLSGFSIRLSVRREGLRGRVALAHYARRRAVRILPLYWFALCLSGLVAAWLAPVPPPLLSLSTLCGNLLFLQTAVGVPGLWFWPYAANGALWSLSFEVFYYAAYPLLVWLLPQRTRRLGWLLVACGAAHLIAERWPNPFAMFVTAAPIWYFGVELAELYLGERPKPAWGVVCALALLAWGSQYTQRAVQFYGLWIGCLLYLAGAALIALPVRTTHLGAWQRAALEPFARVGDISYALYLLHVPVLRALVGTLGDRPLALLLALGISPLLAHASEQLALRWIRRASAQVIVTGWSTTAPNR